MHPLLHAGLLALSKQGLPAKATQTIAVTIAAPRLRLAAAEEVHATFPPAGAKGGYGLILPHAVLSRRALPWERRIAATADGAVPWLALLVLSDADLAGGSTLVTLPAGKLTAANSKPDVLGPVFAPPLTKEEEKESVTALEMSEALFRRLCPTTSELSALAHVRQVSLLDKAVAAGKSGRMGEFAAVLANRFPADGGNTALLVSLEGWGDWLAGSGAREGRRVRVVVLHSWRFTSVAALSGTFAARGEGLTLGPLAVPALADWNAGLQGALAQGYVPVAHQRDRQRKSVAWYRGPLTPVAVPQPDRGAVAFLRPPPPISFAGGGEDISYASAWRLGRVLALSAGDFGQAMRRWNHAKARERLRPSSDGKHRTLLEDMAGMLASQHNRKAGEIPHPLFPDALAIAAWLGRLVRLEPVPLRYLAPSGRALPPESLRFFQVDDGWVLDALVMGALSVGTETLPPDNPTRIGLRKALRGLFGSYRKISGDAAVPSPEPMRGVLLRSRLLHEFPGVEITLWADQTPIRPLRLDRIGDDVLLVLTDHPTNPTKLILREPREGLSFGCKEKRCQDIPFRLGGDRVADIATLAKKLKIANSGARLARYLVRTPTDFTIPWEAAR